MNDVYLSHHGILGQKWGVRRFQNADGSLTDAGRKRYNTGKAKTAGSKAYPSYDEMQQVVKQKNMEKAYDKALSKNDTSQSINDLKNAADQTRNATNAAKNAYRDAKNSKQPKPDVSQMTNKELQDAITRMNLEDNYIRLVQQRENSKRGEDYVEKALDTMGTVAQVASAAATVAAVIWKIKHL